MKSSKVITKDNKIIRKNQNLFEECGKKLYFYIDSSVNRSEYRRLDTLIEVSLPPYILVYYFY